MHKLPTVLLFAASMFFCETAKATVLARCSGSQGQAYFDGESVWVADAISKGSFEFVADDKGNPNIYFIDVTGKKTDSAADGAKLSFSFIHPRLQEFGIVAVYEATGVVETYNVINTSAGRRKVFWTSNKSTAAALAKVSAFVADCR